MKRLKAQYEVSDPETVISDRAWAQRLLNRASLGRKERLDVFYSAGGTYATQPVEKALPHRCAEVHLDERRLPSSPLAVTLRLGSLLPGHCHLVVELRTIPVQTLTNL